MNVVLKRKTGNAKLTGGKTRRDVWVVNPADTYDTCPTTCDHLPKRLFDIAEGKGLPVSDTPTHACYANGRVAAFAVKGGDTLTLTEAVDIVISEAPNNALVRWAEVGDIMTADPRSVIDELARIRQARPDVTLIAYTHAWRMLGGYGADIFRASCETPLDILLAESMGYRTSVVTPVEWGQSDLIEFRKANGLGKVFVCPATTGKGRSCIDCRACDTSSAHVAFPAHGVRGRWASQL